MYYNYDDEKINYYGRWGKYDFWGADESMTSTTTGAYFEFTVKGGYALMHFGLEFMAHPYPHLYVSVDGTCSVEVPLDKMVRVKLNDNDAHKVTVLIKSAVEAQHRWYAPLESKVSLMGIDAEEMTETPKDKRKTMEIVGDSISEGVLIDAGNTYYAMDVKNRVYQNDVTATYEYLTATELGFRPIIMGYGAVGTTKSGSGSVPKAALAYPYCFDGVKTTYEDPDVILINHGANDAGATPEKYTEEYGNLLDTIINIHPTSKIIVLSAFCGAHTEALEKFVKEYSKANNKEISFISSAGWIPKQPLHPLRDGHRIVADNLKKALKEIL